ncbi:MAG: DUF3883 domain-containing protein [Candidatus Coprovivens sp.]
MKNKIRFKIDEKSLFIGPYNDYQKGQTATVSTPLNQSKDQAKWRNDILELSNYNCNIDNPPAMLIHRCQSASHSGNNIDNIFVFKNILIDGRKLNVDAEFAMYFKRETDEYITKLNGTKTKNTHLGRIKLHYPITFSYKGDGYNIDNQVVLNEIMKQNGGFAYVVRGFEYFEDTKTLNFITSLIGPEGIPLSTVFRRQKGVGQKLMIDPNKVVDNDYVVVVEQTPEMKGANVSYELINRSRAENGKLGEEFIYNLLLEKLGVESELYHTSLDFPQSPYDMEYIENGEKKYIEVKSTSGNKPIFNMSSGELKFMEKYKDSYKLYMVMNVKNEFPDVKEYTYYDIMKMRKEYPSVRFYA